ncbi:hypothetical protein [Sphingomonas sp. MMS24-J13]|uniref:hypothetical protein n=1 Tax=Sphingomonas sp. MMS24-J13 TaxID=3238686 RepID=UPI0038505ACF
MAHLDFWLHMNDQYMWQWLCYDHSGKLFAMSAESFFNLPDAERAIDIARSNIGHLQLAA